MASPWRKIHSSTLESFDVMEMPSDTCRLIWAYLPMVCDRAGRATADSRLLASQMFPFAPGQRRAEIGIALEYFSERGMVTLYTGDDGREYLEMRNFAKYQGAQGRAPESTIPAPPTVEESLVKEPRANSCELLRTNANACKTFANPCELLRTQENSVVDVDLNVNLDVDVAVELNSDVHEPEVVSEIEFSPIIGASGDDAEPQQQPQGDSRVKTAELLTPPQSNPLKALLFKTLDDSGIIIGSAMQAEAWSDILEITDNQQLILDTFEECAKLGKQPTPKYVSAILTRCVENNTWPGTWKNSDKVKSTYKRPKREFVHPISGKRMVVDLEKQQNG